MLWQIWIFCGVMKNWMRKGGLFFILFNFFILEFSKYGTSLTIFTLKYKYLLISRIFYDLNLFELDRFNVTTELRTPPCFPTWKDK